MRGSVLEQLAKLGSVAHVFVLTYNVDLIFIERSVLPALRKCGHPALTILSDAGCAAESFARQRAYLPRLGKRYRVAPVLAPGAAFHPKAILATSDARATLLVGSGNASFGGWSDNAEVWARYDSDAGGLSQLAAFRAYVDQVLGRLVDAESIRRELSEAADPAKRAWAREAAAAVGLVGRVGTGPSLLERVLGVIGEDPVDEMIVAAPYYDPDVEAVAELARRSRARSVRLLVPARGSTLSRQARALLDATWTVEATQVLRGPKGRPAFVHAKWYAFVRGSAATVLIGSANMSRAAWTLKGDSGNAELLAVRTMSLDEVRTQLIGELDIRPNEPELADESELEEDEAPVATPEFVAVAKKQRGRLRVSWHAPAVARLIALRVDGLTVESSTVTGNALELEWAPTADRVVVSFALGSGAVVEVITWVDDERELATSAGARRMVDLAGDYAKDGVGELSAWVEILEPFQAELREAAASAGTTEGSALPRVSDDGTPIQYEWSDVFPEADEQAPGARPVLLSARTSSGRAAQVRSILLHALDALLPDDAHSGEEVEDTDIDDVTESAVPRAGGREPAHPIPPPPPTAHALARAVRTVKKVVDALTDPRLLAHRAPGLLRRDITLLATLLRVARREKWIDSVVFAQLSVGALTTLLVAGERKGKEALPVGWLEQRRRTDSEQRFAEDIAVTGFVAAMCAWLSDTLEAASTTEERDATERAGLAAFSTLRWLFDGTRASSFGLDLARSVAIASAGDPSDAWEAARRAWRRWDRSGRAVLRLENALRTKSVAEWRAAMPVRPAVPGDVVFTGMRRLGLVHAVDTDGHRSHVVVMSVTGAVPVTFAAAFVFPVDEACISALGDEAPRWVVEARTTIDRLGVPVEAPPTMVW